MIKQILKDLVESYQESEFNNFRNDISILRAKQKLLGRGSVYFYAQHTYHPKVITDKGCISVQCNPLIADPNGNFPEVDGEGDYTIKIEDKNGNVLLITDVQGG